MYFLYDMALHMGLGFGINEVYIMTPHWAVIVPIALAYLLQASTRKQRLWLRTIILALTVYLLIHNEWLLWGYMLS